MRLGSVYQPVKTGLRHSRLFTFYTPPPVHLISEPDSAAGSWIACGVDFHRFQVENNGAICRLPFLQDLVLVPAFRRPTGVVH